MRELVRRKLGNGARWRVAERSGGWRVEVLAHSHRQLSMALVVEDGGWVVERRVGSTCIASMGGG